MICRKFSKRQLLAMTWWNKASFRDRDAIICDGAVRSGKTFALCCGFFLWSMASFDGGVFALCGKTVSSLRRNIIIHLQSWLGSQFVVTEHRQDNCLTVQLGDKVNTYYLFGGQDEHSYMLIQGITLAGVLLDEVVLMPRSFVEQAVARCSVAGSKMWFSCNPGSVEHWFYKEWVCKIRQKNALYLHFTMDDNPGLSAEVRRRYDRLYTGMFYRRYVLGQWCKAQGLVYEFDERKHLCHAPPEDGRWYISVDYGTQNPFSAGLWCVVGAGDHTGPRADQVIGPYGEALSDVGADAHIRPRTVREAGPYRREEGRRCVTEYPPGSLGASHPPLGKGGLGERIPREAGNDNVGVGAPDDPHKNGCVNGGTPRGSSPTERTRDARPYAVRVKEFYYSGRERGKMMTDEEYADALEDLAGTHPVECVIVDPSAASFIAVLRKRGKFRVRKARNAVLPGIRRVASLLQQGRLLFCPGCKDAIREFSLYCWEDDSSRDAPKKENDHAMDEIRYFVMTVMGRN